MHALQRRAAGRLQRVRARSLREGTIMNCPYGGPRSHCTICALGGHRGQVPSIRPLHLGAVVVTRGPRTCFVCGVPITGDMPWTPDRTEHALARLRCHAAVTCPRCTMPAAADGYCWRCGLPREEKATMRELSDADLQECIVSGQWRCTVEEVQAAATRLLKEKRAARTFTVTTPDGVNVVLHVGPKEPVRWRAELTKLAEVTRERDELRDLLIASVPEDLVGNAELRCPGCGETMTSRIGTELKARADAADARLREVLAFVHALATCTHAQADQEWCPDCGARNLFPRTRLLTNLAARAIVLDGRAASSGAPAAAAAGTIREEIDTRAKPGT